MAIISPFRAWRYDPEHVPLQQAVTQPYDKITPPMQEAYYNASPYNLVRIILGKRQPDDGTTDNVSFAGGIELPKLAPDRRFAPRSSTLHLPLFPDLHPLRNRCTLRAPGLYRARPNRGVFRQCGLPPRADARQAKSRPPRPAPRHPRPLRSDLHALQRSRQGRPPCSNSAAAPALSNAPPDIEVTDEYGVLHRVWKISDAAVIASVQQQMRDRKLIIADGHHRYETALTYRNERRATAETGSGLPMPYDSVMMTFVDMDLPGLVILPTHRLVFGLPSFSPAQFQGEARRFFNVEDVDPAIDAARATTILQNAGHAGTALLAVTAGRAFLLHTPKAVGTPLFGKLSLRQQSLDVVQLHKCLLEGVLRISEDSHSRPGKCLLLSRGRGSLDPGAKRKSPDRLPNESRPHRPGSRHRIRRRSAAPEVHRLLSQVAKRPHHLCAGVKPERSTQ